MVVWDFFHQQYHYMVVCYLPILSLPSNMYLYYRTVNVMMCHQRNLTDFWRLKYPTLFVLVQQRDGFRIAAPWKLETSLGCGNSTHIFWENLHHLHLTWVLEYDPTNCELCMCICFLQTAWGQGHNLPLKMNHDYQHLPVAGCRPALNPKGW